MNTEASIVSLIGFFGRLHEDDLDRANDALLSAVAGTRGILVADDNAGMGRPCWILHFGAYGWTKVLAWGYLEDALEDAASVLPVGMFSDLADEYKEALAELVESGMDPEDEDTIQAAQEAAEVDMTYTESGYLASWEWGYSIECPTLEDILAMEVKS